MSDQDPLTVAADGPGAPEDEDDLFTDLARRSGAELRRTASAADLEAVVGRARRRQRRQAAGAIGAVLVLFCVGLWWTARESTTVPVVPPDSTGGPATTVVGVPLPGEVTYQRLNGDGVDLRRVRLDGGDGGVILAGLPTTGPQSHLDWSPDGSRVVVTVTDDRGADDLWMASADGRDGRPVVDCEAPCLAADEAAWAPDGSTIAFWRVVQPADVATSTLELLDVATGTTRVLLTAPANTVILAPRWSPDGDRLVVEWLQLAGPGFDAAQTGDIVGLVDVANPSAGIKPLTDATRFANNPDWSRVDDLIVFAARVPGASTLQDLYVVAPDGSEERRLTVLADEGDMAVEPTFTPDGSAVLFADKVNGGVAAVLRTVPTSGGAAVSVSSTGDVPGEFPRMRPSG